MSIDLHAPSKADHLRLVNRVEALEQMVKEVPSLREHLQSPAEVYDVWVSDPSDIVVAVARTHYGYVVGPQGILDERIRILHCVPEAEANDARLRLRANDPRANVEISTAD